MWESDVHRLKDLKGKSHKMSISKQVLQNLPQLLRNKVIFNKLCTYNESRRRGYDSIKQSIISNVLRG